MDEGFPGLLSGNFDISNPQTLGLLSFAANMLEAGARSPRRISFGEALARGMRGGLSGYLTGKQVSANNLKAQREEEEYRTKKSMMDRVQRLFSGDSQQDDVDALPTVGGDSNKGDTPFNMTDPVDAFDFGQAQSALSALMGGSPTMQDEQHDNRLSQDLPQQQQQARPQQKSITTTTNAFNDAPPMGSAPRTSQTLQTPPIGKQQNRFPLTLNDIAQMRLAGLPDFFDMYKYVTDGTKIEPNSYVKNPMTGEATYYPGYEKGQSVDSQGRVYTVPGFTKSNAEIKGAEAMAKAAADAQFAYEKVFDPTTGETHLVSRADLAGVGGGNRGGGGMAGGGKQGTGNRTPIANERADNAAYKLETAKNAAEMYKGLQTAAMKAPSKISKLQQLDTLLADHDGGKLSNANMVFQQFANSLGIKISNNLPAKEAATAIINQLALSIRDPSGGAGMPGALSDADRVYLINSVPNLMQSAEGRKLLIQHGIALEQRNIDVARMARAWQQRFGRIDAPDPRTGKNFQDQLSEWSQRNPLFRSKEGK